MPTFSSRPADLVSGGPPKIPFQNEPFFGRTTAEKLKESLAVGPRGGSPCRWPAALRLRLGARLSAAFNAALQPEPVIENPWKTPPRRAAAGSRYCSRPAPCVGYLP